VSEPVVSAGKLVRDDEGQPLFVQRYSDRLLAELLRARRSVRRERSFQLPALHSIADSVSRWARARPLAAAWAERLTYGLEARGREVPPRDVVSTPSPAICCVRATQI